MEDIALYHDSFQNWKSHDIRKAQLILTDIPYQLGSNAYGFELKREFVKGFYDKILPCYQPDMFIQSELDEKRNAYKTLFGDK